MNEDQQLAEKAFVVSRHERDDGYELVADLGSAVGASVDVVGETVIVVTDDDQYEVDVEGDAQAFIKNGVLTIEVNQ